MCDCNCQKQFKVPKLELKWLKAQREKKGSKSSIAMSIIDHKEIKSMDKRASRREKYEKQLHSKKIDDEIPDDVIQQNENDSMDISDSEGEEYSCHKTHVGEKAMKKRNYLDITHAIEPALR